MTAPRRPEPARSVAVVVPIRQLDEHGEPVVVRRPGRPRRVERAPTVDEGAYHAAVAAEVARAIDADPIVASSDTSASPRLILEQTMREVAREAASLRWERERAVREGRADAERISSRRVAALVRLGELAVAREQLRRDEDEPEPEEVARVVELLVAAVAEVIEETTPPQTAKTFMARLRDLITAAGSPSRACQTANSITPSS